MASYSPATFDARTSYREDWRYVDGVEDGVLVTRRANAEEIESQPIKVVEADVTRRDFQQLGLGLLLSPNSKTWFVWRLFDDARPEPPEPTIQDAIEIDDEHWLIQEVASVRHGAMFVCVCTKGRVNE